MEFKLILAIIGPVLTTIAILGGMLAWFNLPELMKMVLYLDIEIGKLFNKIDLLRVLRNDLKEKVENLLDERKTESRRVIDWFRKVDDLETKIKTSDDSIEKKWNKMQSIWYSFFGLRQKWKLALEVREYLDKVAVVEESRGTELADDERLIEDAPEMLVIFRTIEKKGSSMKEKERELINLKNSTKERNDLPLEDSLLEEWFKKVDSLIESSSKTHEEYQRSKPTQCENGPFPCENCQSCKDLYTLGKKIEEILNEADGLQREGNALEVKVVDVQLMPISSSDVFGLEESLQKVLELIKEDGSAAIWGMGGVGKTTLLSLINNHHYRKSVRSASFDIVIFVTAGKGACISKVQADIGKRLGISGLSESGNINEQAREIWKSLRSKNCLLLVDDVWEKIEPDMLGMVVEDGNNNNNNQEKKRNAVVITTRDERLLQCRQKKTVELGLLSDELSWKLFCKHVDNDELLLQGDGEIQRLARGIVKECGGLPLALLTVGKSLSGARSKPEWRVARKNLENSAHTFEDVEKNVLVPLRFSFERLNDDGMHNILFLCMCRRDIDIRYLLKWLLGESKQDVSDESYFRQRCLVHIVKLVQCGLLMCSLRVEEIGNSDKLMFVWLHDCVRDMLSWLIDSDRDKYLEIVRCDYDDYKEKRCCLLQQKKWERAGRIYMTGFRWKEFPTDVVIPGCKKLFFFVAERCHFVRLPETFFPSMESLRLVDLCSSFSLEELPDSIGCLINLRCLDLSYCRNLKKLPKGMRHLKQLVYLFLVNTGKLKDIPRECLSELHKLQVLRMSNCAFEWTWDSEEQQASLHDIRKLMEDGVLRNADFDFKVDKEKIMETIVDSPRFLSCIERLIVDFRNFSRAKEQMSLLTKNMWKMEGLRSLVLKCILEDSVLHFEGPWPSPPKKPPLQFLTIEDCPKLNHIANKTWKFHNLRSVIIKKCPELKHVPFNPQNAPNLIRISDVQKRHLIGKEEVEDTKKMMTGIVGERSMAIEQEDVPDWILLLREKEELNSKLMEKKVETLKRLEEERKMKYDLYSCSERVKEWFQNVDSFIDCTSRVFFANKDDIGHEVCLPRKNKEDFIHENGKQLIQFYQEVFAQHRRLIMEELESRDDEILHIRPFEIRFPFELHKKTSCSLQLSNITDTKIRFHVRPPTTIRNQYCIRPDSGTMEPRSTMEVVVTMEALMEVPIDLLQCNDKFMVQASILNNDDQQTSTFTEEKKYMLAVTYDATSLNICDSSYYGIILPLLLKYHSFLNEGVHLLNKTSPSDELYIPFGVVDCWAIIKVLAENDPTLVLRRVKDLKLDFRKLGEGEEDIKLLTKIMVDMESLSSLSLEYIEDQHFHLLFKGLFPPKLERVNIRFAGGDILSNLETWKLFPPGLKNLHFLRCENLTTLLLSRPEDINTLEELWIYHCPKLHTIEIQSCQFPRLERVNIVGCPALKLNVLPFTSQNAPMLNRILWDDSYIWIT